MNKQPNIRTGQLTLTQQVTFSLADIVHSLFILRLEPSNIWCPLFHLTPGILISVHLVDLNCMRNLVCTCSKHLIKGWDFLTWGSSGYVPWGYTISTWCSILVIHTIFGSLVRWTFFGWSVKSRCRVWHLCCRSLRATQSSWRQSGRTRHNGLSLAQQKQENN